MLPGRRLESSGYECREPLASAAGAGTAFAQQRQEPAHVREGTGPRARHVLQEAAAGVAVVGGQPGILRGQGQGTHQRLLVLFTEGSQQARTERPANLGSLISAPVADDIFQSCREILAVGYSVQPGDGSAQGEKRPPGRIGWRASSAARPAGAPPRGCGSGLPVRGGPVPSPPPEPPEPGGPGGPEAEGTAALR